MSKLDELDKVKEIIKRNLPSAYHKENGEPCDFLPVKEIEKIASEACELGKLEEREAIVKKIEEYFNGLIVIPDPQATKDKLLSTLNNQK